MGQNRNSPILFWAVFVLILFILFSAPKAHGQVPGQPANKEQAAVVLKRLVDNSLVGMGILLGEQTTPGTYFLVLGNGEKCGQLTARVIADSVWLELLTLAPAAAVIKPSVSDVSLRTKLYLFFGNGQTGWHDGDQTKSVDRQDAWVQRSKRFDDNLVIQFSYGDWYPTLLFDLRVVAWPSP